MREVAVSSDRRNVEADTIDMHRQVLVTDFMGPMQFV